MKTVATSISTYLASFPNQFLLADGYIFTTVTGAVYRYTNAQTDIKIGANTWSATGPVFARSKIRQVRGVEVDTLDIDIAARSTDTVGGVPFLQALRNGVFDGANLILYRFFFSAPGVLVNSTGSGDLILFSGRVADVDVGRYRATMRVNSDLELLNIALPKNNYQLGCLNTLYDTNCTLSTATYTTAGTITGASTTTSLAVALAASAGYFDQGVVTFTSGLNTGVSRTVRTYTPGTITMMSPFPNAPSVSDTFNARPGCDKSQATCSGKFSNLANFRGFPYVPNATSVIQI